MGRKATGPTVIAGLAGPPVFDTEGSVKMRKLGFLMAALWALGLFLIPQTSTAELVAMSDEDLREVTGQAGISIRTEDIIDLNIDAERLTWEPPGANQDPGNPAMFGLANVTMNGWISAPEGIDIEGTWYSHGLRVGGPVSALIGPDAPALGQHQQRAGKCSKGDQRQAP